MRLMRHGDRGFFLMSLLGAVIYHMGRRIPDDVCHQSPSHPRELKIMSLAVTRSKRVIYSAFGGKFSTVSRFLLRKGVCIGGNY